jgi:hypothetical protein
MKPSGHNAKTSFRFITIGLLLTLLSGFALASNWTNVTSFAASLGAGLFGTAPAASNQNNSGGNSAATSSNFVIGTCDTAGPIEVESTGGTVTPTAYATLKASFDAINLGTHTGSITIEVCGDSTETAPAVLNASGSGAASYTDIGIRPVGGAARTISGAIAAGSPMIDFNGADSVTVDGLNTGGNSLTISNTTASATSGTSTIRFIGGATLNTITNSNIQGSVSSSVATNGAVIFFSTDANTANGNDNNTISNNNIGPAGANLPTKAILGNGSTTTTAIGNSGIVINNNNIFDFFGAAVTSAGIATNGGCNTWTITNNRLYQTGTRTWTTGALHSGMNIAPTTATSGAQGFTITGNTIGYASNTQTGTYTLTGNVTGGRFIGIFFNGIVAGTASTVSNNTIAAVNMSGVQASGTSTSSPFAAILFQEGVGVTSNNTIGSQTGTGSLTFSTTTTSSTDVFGIYNFSSNIWTSSSNNIGSISATNLGASGTFVIYGLRANTATGTPWTAASNLIGGTTANSIQLVATGTSSQVIGMHSSNAPLVFSSNTIRNLTTNIGTGTTTGASVIGINVTTTTPNHTIAQSTIFNLSNTNATGASVVTGIQFTGSTANTVERNLIYGITAATTSATAEVNGIRVGGGTTVYRNNMIALGAGITNALGAAATNAGTTGINGINEASGTDSYFHNSVYIGGSPTAGLGASYAFNGTVTTNVRSFRDNIFQNSRSNAGSTGVNYAVKINGTTANPAGLTINNNVYFANGTGAAFGFFNSLDVANLGAWRTAVGQDTGSFESNPQFNDPTNATPDLHLHPTNSTVAEGNGVDLGVTLDYDGQTRAGLTPVDIGADAGNFSGIDLSAPSISYVPLGNTSSTTNRIQTVTIADATGVATGGNAPRIYFNKNAGAYVSQACSLTTGTTQNGTWDCVIDHALLGGVVVSDVVRFFVVAQDTLGNLAANPSGGFTGTSVNTVTTPPTTPNQYIISTTFTGSLSIGTGETITSLTNSGGLFDQINAGTISGNVVVNLTSDLTAETGTVALNQTVEEGVGGYTITFQSSGAARTISGSNTGALINLNGADRVTFSGLSFGPTGLTIRNTSATTGAVIQMTNDASSNSILNCIIEGGNTSTSSALILLATGTTTGNDNNSVTTSIIRDRTDAVGVPANAIASLNASTTARNSNNVITGNQISNFINNGIAASSGATSDNWTITNNNLSQNAARAGATFGINTGGMAGTNTISGNLIHGFTSTGANAILGFLVGNSLNLTISNNKIYDFQTTAAATGVIEGIEYDGASGGAASLTVTNNMISFAPTVSTAQSVIGIQDFAFGGNTFNAFYNTVYLGGTASGAATSWAMKRGNAAPTTYTARNNLLFNNRTGGTGSHYAGGDDSAATGTFVSNNNFYAGTGATAANFMDYGSASTGTPVSFAAWQAGPPARDASSTGDIAANFTPANIFVDFANNDLHLKATAPASILNAGVPVAGVTTDFDGNSRDASTPDIGADELSPGVLALSAATYSAGEGAGTVTITVNRTGGTDGAVTVDYALTNGSATGGAVCGAGVDFVNTGGTVNFATGQASNTFNVTICNDALFEGNETFNVALSNATGGATIGAQSTAVVTITDDEVAMPGTLQLSSATYTVGEAGGTVTLTVNRTGGSDGAVSVGYTLTDGTATGGAACGGAVDYVNTGGTVNFANGETSKTFDVAICNDIAVEPSETFTATLSGPTGGAVLGSPAAAVVTINDDDVAVGPVTVSATAGTASATYNNLTDAVTAINAGTHQGDIVVSINQTITEPGTVVINGSGAGAAAYTSLLIRPTVDSISDSGATATGRGLIELNGADNVTIDGDNPNTAGTNRNLTLTNTAANTITFTSVIRIAIAATIVTSADNDTFRNLNIIGSATGRNTGAATSTTASENTTFGIFAGPGASTVSNTTAPSAVASVTTGVAAGGTANNLNVSNNSITAAARGVSANGSAATIFPGLQINGNTIGNITAGAVDQVYSVGITAQGSANGVISGNTVWVEGFVGTSIQGIAVGFNSAFGTFTIDSNKVNRVRNNNVSTFGAYGINLGGANNHIVQNNFVSGVINDQTAGTGAFSTTFGALGIRVGSGTGHKIYHNSVHLYGAMPGVISTNLTMALGVVATSQTGVDIRNNIFSNQITGGNPTGSRNVAVFLPSGATVAMNLTDNNNAYFVSTDALSRLAQVGTTIGTGEYQAANFDPTTTSPATNFRAYTSPLSAAGTNDNASFATTTAPPFTSNVNLHIPAATATRLESGGAAVGVAIDIDAETRNATTPDIGADEFAGTPPAANDIAATVLVTPANGATVAVGATFSPQATFTNNGTATQTNVPVRYRIIDASVTTIYNQTAVIPTIAPLQNATVTFPSTSLPAAGTYTIQATAELVGDANTANDSISGTITGVPPISGSVNVGTGETFTSLTNPGGLFQTLNTNGISGNTTVNITSDLTGETGAVALNQLTEIGAGGYTVTFKPSGAARTISGTSAATSGLIILNGADRIVFDGSLSGGTDRSLTITNNQITTGVVIWMRSPNASNGATNNTIKNCILNGAPGPNGPTVAGILTGSGTTLGNDAEAPNSNNTVQNNWIYRVQNSLYLRGGTVAANFDQNWNITGNELGTTVAVDKNVFRGMLIGNSANFMIVGNTVHGIQSTTVTASAMSGIQLGLLLNNGTVANNMISDIKNVSATGTGAAGISVIATSTASNVTIANNFISDVATTGLATVTSNGFGMAFLGSGTGYNLYFNSVNMATNQGAGTVSAAMYVNSTFATAGALNVRNNIFANNETTGARYGVYSTAAATVFTAIDYNDYFAQNVGFIGGSARVTLADWQTATGQDANSKAVDPLFVSATNLHLQTGSPMVGMAVTGTGITTDIDGNTRDATPDIGADELPPVVTPGTLAFSSATYSTSEAGGTVTLTVNRTGGSSGAVTADYALAGGTATGGAVCGVGIDYVNTGGTVSFADTETSKTFNVTICNDATFEPDETFNATLSNPTGGATIGSPGSATVTILNDDPAPGTVSVNDVRVTEGNAGTVNATFTVTYVGNSPNSASVQYATANGTATAGTDYSATSGTVSFASTEAPLGGPVTVNRTVTVLVNGDLLKEANETFFLNLSNPTNATITDGQGVGIIIDEDRAYVGDFDRDLTTDFSVFRPSDGLWYVLQSTNATPKIVPLGTNGDRPVPGDYDGDGLADYAIFRSGTWFILNSSNSSETIVNWGVAGDKAVQGDYDGDSKTDVAIFRPSTGQWWVTRSSDNATYAVNFGISTDRPVQADFDGDAKTDIAVYRDGTWYIMQSSNGAVTVQNWGLATDKPVAGDFDGDGKFDLAVFRDGDWWIVSSLTGATGSIHWGATGDIPVPADYDHDGTSDIAIFRPSSGDWYVLKSSNNGSIVIHWGLNGDIPTPAAYLPQ